MPRGGELQKPAQRLERLKRLAQFSLRAF